jgi:hypothetical protein
MRLLSVTKSLLFTSESDELFHECGRLKKCLTREEIRSITVSLVNLVLPEVT